VLTWILLGGGGHGVGVVLRYPPVRQNDYPKCVYFLKGSDDGV
jgi:hypothetical protein